LNAATLLDARFVLHPFSIDATRMDASLAAVNAFFRDLSHIVGLS
jgi:hypothetical protein